MSGNYTVTADGPTNVISVIAPSREDVLVSNTGSKPCYLLNNPGIPSQGFLLPSGGSKVWVAGQALYVTCASPGDTTTISVSENAGEFYSPAPLNVPDILWEARNVGTSNGFAPSFGGNGTPGDGPNQFYINPNVVADTGYVDISNYNSLNIVAFDDQPATVAVNTDTRTLIVTFYALQTNGRVVVVNEQYYRHMCIPGSTILSSTIGHGGAPGTTVTEGNPQFRLRVPANGTYVRVQVLSAFITGGASVSKYNLSIIGDNRVTEQGIAELDSGAAFKIQSLIYSHADLSAFPRNSGNFSMPVGTTIIQLSTVTGLNTLYGRINCTAMAAADNRISIHPTGGAFGHQLAAIWFDQTMRIGFQVGQTTFNAPGEPIQIVFTNNQAVATQFLWAVQPESQ